MPWCICCLGLEQKSSHSAHGEFLCYLFLSPQAETELPLALFLQKSWCVSEFIQSKFFYFHGTLLSTKGREKDWFLFEKSGMSSNRTPSKAKYNCISFSLGSGKNPCLCFIELSLQAGLRPVNVQENVGEKILLLMRTAPTFPPLGSGFKIQTCNATALLFRTRQLQTWCFPGNKSYTTSYKRNSLSPWMTSQNCDWNRAAAIDGVFPDIFRRHSAKC